MNELKDNLVKFRKAKGLSQGDVAEKLFVTPQAVSRWERGETEPDVETIQKIAEIYGVSVQEIITGQVDGIDPKKLLLIRILFYTLSSLIVIFSLIIISTVWWKHKPQGLIYTFFIVVLIYLIGLLVLEGIHTRLTGRRRKNVEKNTKKN